MTVPNFERYIEHWAIFVEGFYIILQESISTEQLLKANTLFVKFVSQTQQLYGEDAMTYNLHQLLHIPESIINWGPAWSHFGYPFETGNGKLLNTIQAAKGMIHQIVRAINTKECIQILRDNLRTPEDSRMLEFCDSLGSRRVLQAEKISQVNYFGKGFCTDEDIIEQEELSEQARSYYKIVKNRCIFKSFKKKNPRSDNSFAQTDQGTFVLLEEFILDKDRRKELAKVYRIVTEPIYPDLSVVLRIVSVDDASSIISLSSIEKICVHSDNGISRFLSPVPNMLCY